MAGGKWISVKFEILASLVVGAVAFSAIIMSQDGGEYVSKKHTLIRLSNRKRKKTQIYTGSLELGDQ